MRRRKQLAGFFLMLLIIQACTQPSEKTIEQQPLPVPAVKTEKPDPFLISLKESLINAVKNDITHGGYKLLGIEVDSISYKPVSMKDFYGERRISMEKDMLTQQQVFRHLKETGTPVSESVIREDSLKAIKADKEIQMLFDKADTSKYLLLVTYKMTATTTGANYHGAFTKYLFAKDMKEVNIHF